MDKTFDVTLNTMIDETLGDWADFLADRVGVPRGPATALDTDLSTSLQADRLFRVAGDPPTLLHLEMESSSHLGMPDRLLRYNVAATAANGGALTRSVVVLLRPEANASDLTGVLNRGTPPYLTFRYGVVRVWNESTAALLAAGPGLAPLSILTNESSKNPAAAAARVLERLRRPGVPELLSRQLLNSTFFLAGLRYNDAQAEKFFGGLDVTLEDSTTYQLVMRRGAEKGRLQGMLEGKLEGKLEVARSFLLRLGAKRFGPPPASAVARLQAVTDPDVLEPLAERVLDAASWDELVSGL